MKIKGSPIPQAVKRRLKKEFGGKSQRSSTVSDFKPARPRKIFAFKVGDLVSLKDGVIPAHLPTDGIIADVDEEMQMFGVLLGSEKITVWGGSIKYSISR